MSKSKLEMMESNLYKWLIKNRYRLVVVLLVSVALSNVSRLPYINLVFSKDLTFPFIFFVISLVFKVKIETTIKVGCLLFFPAFIFLIIDRGNVAEIIGNLIFMIFASGIVRAFISYDQKENQ